MILSYLLLISGLSISAIAEYYSIMGLMAIFSAAPGPIAIMGISLGVGKLVMASWIKQYWARIPRAMRAYGLVSVSILMMITSIGCFGYLSKAHNDQNLVSGDVGAKLAIYDEKIKTARDNIEADRKQLAQMDAAFDQVMSRSSDEKGADKANAIRNSQKRDRAALAKDIEANQTVISKINDEAAPIRAENRKVEAEVGPIKYIAAFIYGVAPDASMLERAVTWIIIMIVIVFDPLAVIMLLASQMTFGWKREIRESRARADEDGMVDSDPTIMPPPKTIFNVFADALEKRINDFHSLKERFKRRPKPAPVMVEPTLDAAPTIKEGEFSPYVPHQTLVDALNDPGEWTEKDIDAINEELMQAVEPFEPEYVIVEDADDEVDDHPFRGKGELPSIPMTASYMQPKTSKEIVRDRLIELVPGIELEPIEPPVVPTPITPFTFEIVDNEPETTVEETPVPQEPILITRIAYPESNKENWVVAPIIEEPEEVTWTPATPTDEEQAVQQLKDVGYLTETGEVNPEYVPNEEGIAPEEEIKFYPMEERPGDYVSSLEADNAPVDLGEPANIGFGNAFPTNPKKGDTYLRTDFLPNRLFKFNSFKWIQVDKDNLDVYAYEEEYIKHLINSIEAGTYDPESLTETEKEQIAEYLGKNA